MSIETYKTLVVSTAHLTSDEATAFDNPGLNVISGNSSYDWVNQEIMRDVTHYGYIVRLSQHHPWSRKVPKRLRDIRKIAEENGCSAINFDADGPILDGIKTYDW